MTDLDVRTLFLQEFVRKIVSSFSLSFEPKVINQEPLPLIALPKIDMFSDENGPPKITHIREIDSPTPIPISFQNPLGPAKIPVTIQPAQIMQNIRQGPRWEKLEPLMYDPSIESIECPGPDKQLTLKKGAALIPATLVMTQEEIKKFIENMSKETRVPIKEGVFRVETPTWNITAVLSEWGGNRFIITKNQFRR